MKVAFTINRLDLVRLSLHLLPRTPANWWVVGLIAAALLALEGATHPPLTSEHFECYWLRACSSGSVESSAVSSDHWLASSYERISGAALWEREA